MRKTLAASALGAVILLGGPVAAHADTSATPSPAPTATATQTETETKTVTETDRTGLWGLAGLLGLAGLAGLRKKPETHVRPAHVETRRVEPTEARTVRAENNHDVRHTNDVRNDVNNTRTDNLRQGDLDNDGRRDV